MVERGHRPLRRRIEAPQRLDVVADEFRPDREVLPRRKHVDHAAAPAELAVRLDRVAAAEAGVHQPVGQVGGRAGPAEPQIDGGEHEAFGGGHARQEGRRRRHDDARLPEGQRRQGARPRRGDVEVRRHAAVGIHLRRGEREHAPFDVAAAQPFQRGEKEPGVARHAVDVPVRGNHEDQRPVAGQHGRGQRLRRRGQAADGLAGEGGSPPEADAGGGLVEQGAKRQRRGGGGHWACL